MRTAQKVYDYVTEVLNLPTGTIPSHNECYDHLHGYLSANLGPMANELWQGLPDALFPDEPPKEEHFSLSGMRVITFLSYCCPIEYGGPNTDYSYDNTINALNSQRPAWYVGYLCHYVIGERN